jgi:GTP cyclohydrolase I
MTATRNNEIDPTISDIIRERLIAADVRYNSNDNISDFIHEGELDLLIDEVSGRFAGVLDSLLIDQKNDPNANGTARRLAKMYIRELFEGRFFPVPDATAFPNTGPDAYKGMLVVRSELKSVCSHHWQPVTGVAYIGVIPGEKVIGLSKYTRIAQHCARRGTLQEELCNDIVKEIQKATGTSDVAVYIAAEHGCCTNRGIMAHNSTTQTTVLKGEFVNADVKKEFFDNIALQTNGFACR